MTDKEKKHIEFCALNAFYGIGKDIDIQKQRKNAINFFNKYIKENKTMDKKYEIIYDVNKAILVNDDGREVITDDFTYDEIIKTHEWRGKTIHVLYPIRALRDFGNVRKGDLGGCIASENNLSQEGDFDFFHILK